MRKLTNITFLSLVMLLFLLAGNLFSQVQIGTTTYSTLKLAFDAINAGTHTGSITVKVIGNTTETASAVLNASGNGSANYSAISIYPTGNYTVTGNITTALVELRGADNVTIDGRVNQSGSSIGLSFINTSTTSSHIVIWIDSLVTGIGGAAKSNTIQYCHIRGGLPTSTCYGIALSASSSPSTGAYGLDNNKIYYNEICNAYYGVQARGYSNTQSYSIQNLEVKYNSFGTSSYPMGIYACYLYFTWNASVQNNKWNNPTSTMYGCYSYYGYYLNFSYNQIKNISNGTNTMYGLYNYYGVSSTVSYNEFDNISMGSMYPIYNYYSSSSTLSYNKITNLRSASTSTYTIYDIYHYYSPSSAVINNTIADNASGGTQYGIYCYYSENSSLNANKIFNLTSQYASSSHGLIGIYLYGSSSTGSSSGSQVTVSNNSIYGLKGAYYTTSIGTTPYNTLGIAIYGGIGHKIYYNSVNLYGSLNNTTPTTGAYPAAFCVNNSTPTTLDVRDNSFTNTMTGRTGTKAFAIYLYSTANLTSSTFNYNDYYVSGTYGILGYLTSDRTSIAAWRSATSQDVSSFSSDPLYNSATNLRPQTSSPLRNAGTVVSTTSDFYGGNRSSSTPTVGAYEQAGDFNGPEIIYAALTNTNSTSNRAFPGVDITDLTGVNNSANTKPRVYYRKMTNTNTYNDNTSSTDGWKWVETTIATSPYSFDIDYSKLYGGLSPGSIIEYFVIAQDLQSTPWVGWNKATFASEPTSVAVASTDFPVTNVNSYMVTAELTGTYTVGTGGTFLSLTNNGGAFQVINSGSLKGDVVLEVVSDINETGVNALNMWTEINGSGYKLTIRPSAATNFTLSGSKGGGGLIMLNNANRVTFDGRFSGSGNYLTITNTATTSSTTGIHIGSSSSTGGQYNTIRNCNISTGVNTTTSYGIFCGSTTVGSSSTTIDNNSIIENNIYKSYYGLYYYGGGYADNVLIEGNKVGHNTASESVTIRGMQLYYLNNSNVRNNTVFNMTYTSSMVGMTNYYATNTTFSKNIIRDIKAIGGSSYQCIGFYVAVNASANVTYANNQVYNIINNSSSGIAYGPLGFYVNSGSGINLYHNSVVLTGNRDNLSTTMPTSPSACLYLTSSVSASGLDLRNNLFYNDQTDAANGQKSYAIYHTGTASQFAAINNNNYYVAGGQGVLFYLTSADIPTMASWRTSVPADAASINSEPSLNDVTIGNFRPSPNSPLLLVGGTGTGVTDDFLGVTRSTTNPTIGAFEEGVDAAGPIIAYSALLNTGIIANRDLTAIITDYSGVTSGAYAPRLYYKKSTDNNTFAGNTSADNGWKWVNAVVGGSSFRFTFDYSKLSGGSAQVNDQIDYFITAQDMMPIPNLSAKTAIFNSMPGDVMLQASHFPVSGYLSYRILPSFSGTVNVGSGQTYTTLSGSNGVFNAMNNAVFLGDVTVNITSSITIEDGSVGLKPITEEGGSGFTVTIKPSSPTPYTISGSSGTSLIRFEGADRVTIDGSYNNAGRYLTFTNTNASGTFATIHFASVGAGAQNCTVKNCKISTGYYGYSPYSIGIYVADLAISTSGTGANNDNLTISNNEISKATFGLYIRGVASTGLLDNLIIADNIIGSSVAANSIAYRGMDLQNATTPIITDNIIFNITFAPSTQVSGIEFGGTFTDAMIARNKIYTIKNPNSGGWGAFGINSTGGTNVKMINNMISDISTMNYSASSTTYNPFGIRLTSGTGYVLHNNSVYLSGTQTNVGSTASFTACLLTTSTSVTITDMKNNIFVNNLAGTSGTISPAFHIYNTSIPITILSTNYNIYYSSVTNSYLGGYGTSVPGTRLNTLADIISASGQDANSQSFAVDFISASDPHLTGNAIADSRIFAPQLSGVSIDFDKETRRLTDVNIGADEVKPILGFSTNLTFTPDQSVYCSNSSAVSMTSIPTIVGFEDGITRATSPVFQYKWFKDGIEIPGVFGSLLDIGNIQQSDSADYSLQIGYVFKTATSLVKNLKVETEMGINANPVSSSVCSTDPALILNVGASGTINRFQWQKEDLLNPGVFRDLPGQTSDQMVLTLNNPQEAQGNYRALVIGPGNCGPASIPSATASIDVDEPITYTDFSSFDELDNLCTGQDFSMTAVSDGTVMGYQWQYYSQGSWTDIVGETNKSLSIKNATIGKSGKYRALITGSPNCNQPPMPTPEINVYIWPLVEFTMQPVSKLLCRFDSTALLVMIDGTVFGFQWKKDGKDIPLSENFSAQSQMLYLTGMDYDKSGVYTCDVLVEDCQGLRKKESNPALIYVITGTKIISAIDTVPTKLGGTTSIQVRAHAAGAPPEYKIEVQWYRGTQKLQDNDRIGGTKSSILTIKDISIADLGNDYWVTVTALCNSDTARNYGFFIPSITVTEQPAPVTICERDNAVFSVKGTSDVGNYNIHYQWYKGSTMIVDDNRIKGAQTNKMTIMNLSKLDESGDYWCQLSVYPGPIVVESDRTTLQVNTYPQLMLQPDPVISLSAGKELVLYCSAIGTEPLTFQWYKNNAPISGGNDSVYKIAAVTSANQGSYYCVISNICGTVRTDITEFIVTFRILSEVNDNLILGEVSNEPNPFNTTTAITFELNESSFVKLVITDIYGHEIGTLTDKQMEAGKYRFLFDANSMNLSSGTYYYTIQAGKEMLRGKMILVK